MSLVWRRSIIIIRERKVAVVFFLQLGMDVVPAPAFFSAADGGFSVCFDFGNGGGRYLTAHNMGVVFDADLPFRLLVCSNAQYASRVFLIRNGKQILTFLLPPFSTVMLNTDDAQQNLYCSSGGKFAIVFQTITRTIARPVVINAHFE